MSPWIQLAVMYTATTYGYGELKCGVNPLRPMPCIGGALMATGIPFDPTIPLAAIPMPQRSKIQAEWVYLRIKGGRCSKILVADKKHWRYIGQSGFDFSPAAVELLTGKRATKYWSGKVEFCH